MKHIQSFESFSASKEMLDEGLFTKKTPEEKLNSELSSMFPRTLSNGTTKKTVFDLSTQEKQELLDQGKKLKEEGGGNLKLVKKGGKLIAYSSKLQASNSKL